MQSNKDKASYANDCWSVINQQQFFEGCLSAL
jgi:hypothetical protein